MTTAATSCVGNMQLNENGQCEFDGCLVDNVQFIQNGVFRKVARCLECQEGYGQTLDWRCVKCDFNENAAWAHCIDCSVDGNNMPVSCTVCEEFDPQYELIPNGQ